MSNLFKKGDPIRFKAEYAQPHDDAVNYFVAEDQIEGRAYVRITTAPSEKLPLPPINTIHLYMIEKIEG